MANSSITSAETFLDGARSRANSRSVELLVSWVGDDGNGTIPTLAVTVYPGWFITKVITNPGAVAPDAYDITLVDSDGFDLAESGLLARSATVTEIKTMAAQVPNAGFTITLANQATASAVGIIRIFLNR
jgi:hypothetical protein